MNEFSFLGFKFSPLKLEDNNLLTSFLKQYPQRLTGYTFATLAAWKPLFRYSWTFAGPKTLLISCMLDPDPNPHLMQPVGELSASVAQSIAHHASTLPYPLRIIGVSNRFLKENPGFSVSFTVREDRAVSNYIYHASALAKLTGRKYAKKRNLIAQAASLYNWSSQPLTSELASGCFSVLDSIMQEEHPHVDGMLKMELAALECTLYHFDDFHQQGLLIFIDGRPVAFSIYEAISPNTVAVHFERALRSYKGLYQVVNCETAKIIAAQGFEFINREEDLGDPGLRDAKMSYHPIEVRPAHEMRYRV
jgi:hypothetical protein